MSVIVSFREKMEFSFLERLPTHQRMTARDNIGKRSKKTQRKHYEEHFNKDWDKDLWD